MRNKRYYLHVKKSALQTQNRQFFAKQKKSNQASQYFRLRSLSCSC